jgi:predicted O-methyltransferase YrrM
MTHPIRAVIERLLRDGTITAQRDGSIHDIRRMAITRGEGEALRRWVVRAGAARTIEVGLAYGLSALHLCEGLIQAGQPQPQHVVIDPFQHTSLADCGLQVLEEAGVRSLVEHHAELSQLTLPALLKSERQFDLAFIDGNHRFDSVFLDLFYLGRLVRKNGVIILDDYDLPGIRRAVAFYLTNLNWSIEELSPLEDAHSWVVVRTAPGEDTRDFRYFVEF